MLEVFTFQKKLFPEIFWCAMMFNPSIRTKTGRVTLENFYSASTYFNTVSCEDMKDTFLRFFYLINIWKVKDVAVFWRNMP